MAFHFRKLRNTLRLFPSTKTLGFSTRANEGDGIGVCSEGSSAASLARHADCCKPGITRDQGSNEPSSGMSRSQSDSDLVAHFLPTIFSMPSHVLPMTYNDLAQILRLPVPLANSNRDLSNDVTSILKVIHPTSDDILADPLGPGDSFSQRHNSSCSSDAVILSRERIPLEVLKDNHLMISRIPPISGVAPSLDQNSSIKTSSIHTSSSFDPHHHDHCYLSSSDSTSPQGKGPIRDGPSPEQMHKIKEKLEKSVSRLFSGRQDHSILHKNVVLENNLFGDNKTSMGLLAYGVEILKLRLRVHARYSNTSVELQSVTMLEQTGVIRIHWRLKGVSQLQTLKFWRLFQTRGPITKDDYEWLEAFSYFHIGKDGLVHKHRIDRMLPDDASGKEKLSDTLRELLTPAKPLVS